MDTKSIKERNCSLYLYLTMMPTITRCNGLLLALLFLTSASVSAFSISSTTTTTTTIGQSQNTVNPTSTSLYSSSLSRRTVVNTLFRSIGIGSSALITSQLITSTNNNNNVAYADIDYSTIQDLLGSEKNQQTQTYSGGKRPTYLNEPTEEFRINEQKAAEFKRKNLLIKKKFTDALEKITSDPNDYSLLATDIDTVRRLTRSNSGLPEGISKDDVVKICRRRKSKKFWSVEVEIAYQDLLMEIDYQQSPNTDRDSTFL